MKKVFLLAALILSVFGLASCGGTNTETPEVSIKSIAIDTTNLQDSYEVGSIGIDDLRLIVRYSDGSTETIQVTNNMISSNDIEKLSIEGEQTIEIIYGGLKTEITLTMITVSTDIVFLLNQIYMTGVSEGSIEDMTYEEWLDTIKGEDGLPGEDGKEVLFQVSDGYIQWQYTGDETWSNLIDLATLTGADGTDGTNGEDGREVLFQVADGYIQWQYTGDTGWTNLVSLSTLTGADGQDGTDGIDGKEVLFQVSDGYIQWQYTGDTSWTNLVSLSTLTGADGTDGTNGEDGREVLFQVADGYIQWQYTGDTGWTNLVSLSTLTGADGQDGTDGIDGKEVLFQVSDGYIQWQYTGDTSWTNLVSLSTLTGADGSNGTDGIDGREVLFQVADGYIQWQYTGDTDWTNLIDLDVLTGASAYELYLLNYPEYEGTEIEWLEDLINGRLADIEQWDVTYDYNNGVTNSISVIADNLTKLAKPTNPTREGYTFLGWFINGEQWMFTGFVVTEDITLTALWEANTYSIVFDSGAGDVETGIYSVTYDEYFELPVPSYYDHIFLGWYNGQELVESGTWNIAQDVILTAYWVQEQYTVFYDYGYDELIDSNIANYDDTYTPIVPSRVGYTFDGWYDEENNLYEGGTWHFESDLNLIAKWTANTYTITLDVNGGTMSESISYEVIFDQLFSLPVPTPQSSPFYGWYLGDTRYTDEFGISIVEFSELNDITLVAQYFVPISTYEELNSIRNDLDNEYRLINDVDITGYEWVPIGDDINPFTGIFDGQGYKITGLTITQPHDFIGLFGVSSGELKYITLDLININVTGAISQEISGGSLVGFNTGNIYSIVNLSGSIYLKVRTGANGYLGGIIGYNSSISDLSDLHNSVNITGDLTTYTGGLIGYCDEYDKVLIIDSSNAGTVIGVNYVGGLIGLAYETEISSSSNTGEIFGIEYVGGLAGKVGLGTSSIESSLIFESSNTGQINGNERVGGLVGEARDGIEITNSFNSGNLIITGEYSAKTGGLLGSGYSVTISSSFNFGDIGYTWIDTGGLVGVIEGGYVTISIAENYGDISGEYNIGGLIGYASATATLANVSNMGTVTGKITIGGFIGYSMYDTIISYSFNGGDISSTANLGSIGSYESVIGGFVGYAREGLYIYNSLVYANIGIYDNNIPYGFIVGNSVSQIDIEDVYYYGSLQNYSSSAEVLYGSEIVDKATLDNDFLQTILELDSTIWSYEDLLNYFN